MNRLCIFIVYFIMFTVIDFTGKIIPTDPHVVWVEWVFNTSKAVFLIAKDLLFVHALKMTSLISLYSIPTGLKGTLILLICISLYHVLIGSDASILIFVSMFYLLYCLIKFLRLWQNILNRYLVCILTDLRCDLRYLAILVGTRLILPFLTIYTSSL